MTTEPLTGLEAEDDGGELHVEGAPDTVEAPEAKPRRRRTHTTRAERIARGEVEPTPEEKAKAEKEGRRRIGGLFGRRPEKAAAPRHARKGKRKPADEWLEWAYGACGRIVEATSYYPAGRMMQWQAQAAGVILDDAIAGTRVDEAVVQPTLDKADELEALGFLVAPPLLMALASRSDEARIRLEEPIRLLLRESLIRLAPAIDKARKREEAAREAVLTIFPPGSIADDEDPVDHLFAELFAVPLAPQHSPTEVDDAIPL